MNSLERVRNTLAGRPADHLACQPMLMMFAARHCGVKYIDYCRDGRILAEAQWRTVEDFGVDATITCSDPAREVIDIAGDGSVDWFDDQGPVINESRAALSDKSRLRTLRVPDLPEGGRMYDRVRSIRILRQHAGADLSVVGWVEGPLALAAELRGLNNLMLDFIDDPAFVHDLLDFCAAVAIAYAPAQIEAGADTIAMSDAAASMIGPELYRDFVQPRQKRVYESIKSRDPHVMTRSHMCGRTNELAGLMRQMAVDIYEIDFPSDLGAMRRGLDDCVISGNISTITDLLQGTPAQVYAAAAACHRICGARHIVNPGCEVSPLTPPDNLRAIVRYAREHRPVDQP